MYQNVTSLHVRLRATRPSMHDRWRKTNQKRDREKQNVPLNVRPGSEVCFELGQVGHGELLFRVEARIWRGRRVVFGSMFALPGKSY